MWRHLIFGDLPNLPKNRLPWLISEHSVIWVGYLQKGLKPFFEKIEIIGNSEALLTKVYEK